LTPCCWRHATNAARFFDELLAEVDVDDEPVPELLPHAARAPLATSVAIASGTRRLALLIVMSDGSFPVVR
jgi:hypothetical protein